MTIADGQAQAKIDSVIYEADPGYAATIGGMPETIGSRRANY